jgi:RNase P subunit RPR2
METLWRAVDGGVCMNEIVKCMKCEHVLISGSNMIALFGPGTSIACRKCGNKHVFGEVEKKETGKITFVV